VRLEGDEHRFGGGDAPAESWSEREELESLGSKGCESGGGTLTHLHAKQSFRLISAFSKAFFEGSDDGPARAVEYVETS
jgi:hypothetical protein